ncbi:AAA family ATPase [Maribellus comscasis]|uniref:AAA family ATPase n=1 Tax=Maribellus comscasis TaxID=2681766 RepID=A0A6I6JNF0_9BACT|nr:ATP-binding protein [Maribellus comscasis]QGY42500.1 AAA family ATPase [Maribellus comscasis]
MEFLKRSVSKLIIQNLKPNKVVILLGARRTGKSVLIKKIISELSEKHLFLDGDDFTTLNLFQPRTIENFRSLIGNVKLLVIDEAQQIPDIGKSLKLIVDHIPDIKVLITGSSAFDIHNKIGEPLTGRKTTLFLYPFSQAELNENETIAETAGRLNERLVLGHYPELIHLHGKEEKARYLRDLVSSYLLKDILTFEGIRNADKIRQLLRLIAFQIGKEVSLHELGRQLGMHKNTVEKYLDLLSKTFVIYGIGAFNRNLRNEISKSKRWYFYDNGIRNILIENVNDLQIRNDTGELWENYIISERIKFQQNSQTMCSNYFWRTYQQQEIDWIEEREGKLFAYEMKWNPNKKVSVPSGWKSGYPEATFEVISPKNYIHWIT